MTSVIAPLEIEIHPGEHPEGHFFGMTFNLDTIWVTVVAGAIVVALGFWAKAKLTEETDGPRPDQDPAGLGDDHRPGHHAGGRPTSAR